jgi:undecaprenyl-diphosphatase
VLDVLFLAIVQGIAEFLPISSSGHLAILGAVLQQVNPGSLLAGQRESPTLEIILHGGTLGSILLIYWRRILDLLFRDRRVVGLLLIGTLPAAVVGLTIKFAFESILKSIPLAACMLMVTGVMLLVLGRLRPREGEYRELHWHGALLIGCFQAFAIFPGISRSGSTILGGRLLGLRGEDSVTFSFLLAIPAILGATLLAVKDVVSEEMSGGDGGLPLLTLAAGAGVAFVVGLLALRWLIQWSRLDRLHWFAWWCLPAGIISLAAWSLGILR